MKFPFNDKPTEPMYRLQLPNLNWTEWRPIEEIIKEPYILSLQITEWVTPEQYKEFCKQLTVAT